MNPRTTLRQYRAVHRARRWLTPGAAVILDTETTDFDGQIIEIAVIDAATGTCLLDTLVRPSVPIAPDATAVHGITDQMCQNCPTWDQVWPQLQPLLDGRRVLAYNAPFDQGRIEAECQRHHQPTGHLRWSCIMRLDADARGTHRWRKLDADHRALGDARAARNRLQGIATTRPASTRPRPMASQAPA